MPKIVILAVTTAAFSAALTQSSLAQQSWNRGCFRWRETGHHWYNFCVGPDFLYPITAIAIARFTAGIAERKRCFLQRPPQWRPFS
jgi:hypothetical protein